MENGLDVILQENRTAPVVALQMWVKVGSGNETDDEAGMCHFVEHMLFKGTEKRKVREMAKEIESLGGSINAYTSYPPKLGKAIDCVLSVLGKVKEEWLTEE